MPHHARTGQRLHLELAGGGVLDLRIPYPHHTDQQTLPLEVQLAGVTTVSGRDLHVNLHDNGTGTIRVRELDALGVDVADTDEVPVSFTLDRDDVVSVTDNGDLTASVAVLGAASVGQTAVVTVSADLPDGTTAQGSVAIAVVAGGVKTLEVDATEDDATV